MNWKDGDVRLEEEVLRPVLLAVWANAELSMWFQPKRSQKRPRVGLSLMPDSDFLVAAQPLFEAGRVEALEWSFDMGWGRSDFPSWAEDLLQFYSDRQALIGHGVSFSLLSAQRSDPSGICKAVRQEAWLEALEEELQAYQYQHISEHFGWMAAGEFRRSAPLPLPFSQAALEMGCDRLQRLAAFGIPVGLENLAFAFGLQDVEGQGQFLEALLQPVNGFLVLDLHNLYCQLHNFGQLMEELFARYPLHRVRELHVSGGSWSQDRLDKQIRRDTHDGAVPEPVFELLRQVLGLCPQVEFVIFERMGGTLADPQEMEEFRNDFERIKTIVENSVAPRSPTPRRMDLRSSDDMTLDAIEAFQVQLLEVLDRETEAEAIVERLAAPAFRSYIETFEGRMVEVAAELVKKWGDRG
jgi:uncharacterized protein